jgi:putative hydrolase of HD superfamily
MADLQPAELEALARFVYESGQLKRAKRAGWWLAGIKDPETIAEHSFRTALIGYMLAVMEGANPERVATLCLFHDTQETRVGDIPSVGHQYLAAAPNTAVTEDQISGSPEVVVQAVRELVEEYEDRDSLESLVAHDADKLECLFQAREYQAQGYPDVPPWIETSAAGLQTESGRRLAEAAQQVPPKQWWKTFVENFGRHRRGAPGSDLPSRQAHPDAKPRS